jgi:hypothetical protein
VLPTNGGRSTQREFLKELVDGMERTSETTVISRCTPNRLIDYQGDALLCACPMQEVVHMIENEKKQKKLLCKKE